MTSPYKTIGQERIRLSTNDDKWSVTYEVIDVAEANKDHWLDYSINFEPVVKIDSKLNSRAIHLGFIKHLLQVELGLRPSVDYLILPAVGKTIPVLFSKKQEEMTSLALLIWPKYKTARFDNGLT